VGSLRGRQCGRGVTVVGGEHRQLGVDVDTVGFEQRGGRADEFVLPLRAGPVTVRREEVAQFGGGSGQRQLRQRRRVGLNGAGGVAAGGQDPAPHRQQWRVSG
jgi:hypothetical protein